MKKKFWKLQSNDRLSSKLNNGSSPSSTPIQFYNSITLTDSQKQELQGFALPSSSSLQKKQSIGRNQVQRESIKMARSLQFQEMQRKAKERQELRLSTGGTTKTMIRMHEQLRKAERQLEEKQLELVSVNSELNMTEESVNLRKRHTEDITNNRNMLKFKEDQLSNLKAIHAEIVEGIKKQITQQRQLRQFNSEKYVIKKKALEELRKRLGQKQNMVRYIEELNKQKMRLQKFLQEFKETEARKYAMRSGAVRDFVQKIIKANKTKLQAQCQQKIKIIRDASVLAKNKKQFKFVLENKGVTPKNYLTFSQLKFQPEFNFKKNKQAEYILQMFDREVKPKLIDIVEESQSPQQLADLRNELNRLQDFKALSQVELKQKELVIEQLKKQKKELQTTIKEAKSKIQNK